MKLIHESPCCLLLLHLLLLVALCVPSSPQPTRSPALCYNIRSMSHHMGLLMDASKRLHNLENEQLQHLPGGKGHLVELPLMPHTAGHIRTLQVNQSLLELYVHTQVFRLHLDWLIATKDKITVSSLPEKGARLQVVKLSQLIQMVLQQMDEDVPAVPSPSFPVVSLVFDALIYSVKMSERLHTFCDWSKRILRHIQVQTNCTRH